MKTLLLNWEQLSDGSYFAAHPFYPYLSDKGYYVRLIGSDIYAWFHGPTQVGFPGSLDKSMWGASCTALADIQYKTRPTNSNELEKRHAKKLLDAINTASVEAIRTFNKQGVK